jgi:hypothetical protein
VTVEELVIKLRATATGVSSTLGKTKKEIQDLEKQGATSKKGLSGLFSGVGVGTGVAAAGVAAGAAVVAKSISTYASYGKEVKSIMRATGASAEAASTIVGQMKLVGGEDLNTADALGRWAVNLYAARDAQSKQGQLMQRLGIDLKDQNGKWRDGGEVLLEYRDKMSQVNDMTERNADLQVMMGRGYRQIAAWFGKSTGEIDDYNKALKDMGMVMSQEDMDTWGKYMADEKMMSMLLTAMQIKIARLVIPALNALMPPLLQVLGVFTKIPGPVLKIVGGLLALGAALKIAIGVRTMAGNLMEMYGSATRLGGRMSNIVSIFPRFVQGFKDSRVASSKFSGVAGTLGGKLRKLVDFMVGGIKKMALWVIAQAKVVISNIATIISNNLVAASYVAIGVAAVAAGVAIYEAIKAYMSWRDAVAQANEAQNNANAENERAFKAGKITQAQYESNKAAIARDAYKPDWWAAPSNAVSNMLGLAQGGEFTAKREQVIRVAEGNKPERVSVTPVGKGQPNVLVTGNTFVGSSRDAERAITRMVNRRLGPQVDRLGRGRFANA